MCSYGTFVFTWSSVLSRSLTDRQDPSYHQIQMNPPTFPTDLSSLLSRLHQGHPQIHPLSHRASFLIPLVHHFLPRHTPNFHHRLHHFAYVSSSKQRRLGSTQSLPRFHNLLHHSPPGHLHLHLSHLHLCIPEHCSLSQWPSAGIWLTVEVG